MVVKSSGRREPFDRSKIVRGVVAASKGRNLSPEQIDAMAESVEESLRLHGPELASNLIGLSVLEHLRGIDEVTYLRFASVYKDFGAASDFQRELTLLEKQEPPAG